MTKNNKTKNNKNNRQRTGLDFPRPPPTGQVTYRGGIPTRTSERGITAILRQAATQATGMAATTLNVIIGNNPSGTDNWADYAAAWTQYRVLGVRIEWQPYDSTTAPAQTGATRTFGSFVNTVLHQTAAPSTNSVPNCFSSGDAKLNLIIKPHVRVWKMLDVNEANWVSTASPATTSYVYSFYANNLAPSSTYGVLFLTYFCQFRTSNT